PDLVFLDIEMPGHSGLELLDFFDENEVDFSVIFVTAYNHYAIQAFKLSAIDYLLKPIEIEDLVQAIELFKKNKERKQSLDALRHNLKQSSSKKIALNSLGNIRFVDTNDILFFQGEGSYTKVFLKNNETITISKNLKNFENLLAEVPDFFRCHKSYIVNVKHISDYVKSDGGYLMVDKKHQIGVSADKVEALLKMLL
ncbi:MAG: LytR/AlgR family response regulator transcription factor, partial [Raineya sp.]